MIQTFSEKKERKLFKPCRRHLCQGGFRGQAGSPWHCRQQGSQSWRPPQSWWTEKDYGRLPLESIIYLLQISVLVQVSVADTISMSKDWNGLGALLDWLHQLVASTGDDQVDVVVQLEEVRHVVSAGDERNGISTPVTSQSFRHQSHQGFVAVGRFLAALCN